MKRNVSFLFSLFALILFVSPLMAGDTPGCAHKSGCCAGKGVAMQVANIDKGVTITLTGENAEAVKSVQDHAAKCAKHECCVRLFLFKDPVHACDDLPYGRARRRAGSF